MKKNSVSLAETLPETSDRSQGMSTGRANVIDKRVESSILCIVYACSKSVHEHTDAQNGNFFSLCYGIYPANNPNSYF